MSSTLKILVLAVFVLLAFARCSKSSDFSASYLKGKIDGVAFECTSNISANKPEPLPGSGSDPTLRITGEWPMYSIKLMILEESTGISTGTYFFR